MKVKTTGLSLFVGILLALTGGQLMAKEGPVAKLAQIEGDVEYSRNGTKWSPVRRTKYLFDGYYIRTGSDGSGKIINQASGATRELGSNSEVKITQSEVELIAGSLSEERKEETSLFQSLLNKFAKAQRYTTVRRSAGSAEDVCDIKVRTIRNVTLSPSHSDLVWRNACPQFSYKLVINDGEPIDVPALSTSEMIRYSVDGLESGEHTYRVEVFDQSGTSYKPTKDSKFVLMTDEEEQSVIANLAEVGDDILLETTILEDQNMYVAAMDAYRRYFKENPEDNDLRPLLIQSYNTLKLSNLQVSEAQRYNDALEGDY